jgi:hypothetical protein
MPETDNDANESDKNLKRERLTSSVGDLDRLKPVNLKESLQGLQNLGPSTPIPTTPIITLQQKTDCGDDEGKESK